jgi:uncharacterized protein YeeX (DUF496 family)
MDELRKPNQQDDVLQAVKDACLDYIEGFYERSADRLTRSVNPNLAKRNIRDNEIRQMTLDELVQISLRTHMTAPEIKVQVLDIHDGMATAKVVSDFVDYLHLALIDGRWQILNVLWDWVQPRP